MRIGSSVSDDSQHSRRLFTRSGSQRHFSISIGFRVSIGIVRRHEDAPEGRDEGGAGEDDQEELVQDPGDLPPLLAYDLPPLLSLVPLLHDDGAQVLPRVLLLPLLKQMELKL